MSCIYHPVSIHQSPSYLSKLFRSGKNGWNRCFHGTINRLVDDEGNPVVYGKIKVGDGYIYAMAENQWELGNMMDEMVGILLSYHRPHIAAMRTWSERANIYLN